MNSFGSRSVLRVGSKEYEIYRLKALDEKGISTRHLPYSLRILLENLLRTEDGRNVTADDIKALAAWNSKSKPDKEIAFTPSRVLLQDFTGVPAVVDLAAMRDAMKRLAGDPSLINPLQPAELVIDHSVQVDEFGTPQSFQLNAELEFIRNKERYAFLRWGQTAFRNLAIVPPDTGIVHQVNLEYLARVVFVQESNGKRTAYPDTLVGTDSHTTMINGLGVLGWGVGGIEAEAAMLGQPVSMLIPQVVGVKLTGELHEGATATDLVLTITEMLRKHGVVGKFVEYFGPGLPELSLADRATIGNMSPEYGATCGIFPVDKESLTYLRLTGRSEEQIALVEAYCREQGMFHDEKTPEAEYSELLTLDLRTVESSLAGPKRPQDRVTLSQAGESFRLALPSLLKPKSSAQVAAPAAVASGNASSGSVPKQVDRWEQEGGSPSAIGIDNHKFEEHVPPDVKKSLRHGSVVIAAITSCTNTSNPSVMVAAGLVAKKAVEKGLTVPPWVKTSLAPGIESGPRLSGEGRAAALSRENKIPHCGLRMHHLHRKLRAAAQGSFGGDRRERSGRGLGTLGQSEFRGPHQLRSARELSDVAAAGGGLRAGGADRSRPAEGSHRQRKGRAGSLSGRPVAAATRSRRDDPQIHFVRHVYQKLR